MIRTFNATCRWVVVGIILAMAPVQAILASEFDPVSMDLPEINPEHPPVLHELLIPSHGVLLTGMMMGANGPGPHPTALLLHGFPGNEKNLDLGQTLRRAGFNVLFFHYRGSWGSQGDYSMAGQADDVAAVIAYVRDNAEPLRADAGRLTLIGHSMGGFTAIRAAATEPAVSCVVGLAAANLGEYANVSEERRQGFAAYTDQLFMLQGYSGADALAELDKYGNQFELKLLGPNLTDRAMLLVTGEADTAVAPDVQGRLFEAYKDVPGLTITAEIIPGDHSFSQNRIQLQRLVLGWMENHCR